MRFIRSAARQTNALWGLLAVMALSAMAAPGASPAPKRPPPAPRVSQREDWNLAWTAFAGAGEINDAYLLAKHAVRLYPDSRAWLTRLAQAAGWTSHPKDALAALERLALHCHEQADLEPALNLAIGLGDTPKSIAVLREMIRLHRATPAQSRMLVSLYLDDDKPQQAIRALERTFARDGDPAALWEEVVIYRMIGDPAHERATLSRYRDRFGPTVQVMLAIATLDYTQGRLHPALDALLAAEPGARPTDTAYWQTLSGLAWALGRYPAAANAAQALIAGGTADASIYQRALYVAQYRHPRHAFEIARQGWRRTQDPALFLAMLDIASRMQPETPWLHRAFHGLDRLQIEKLAGYPSYWTSLASLRAAQGRHLAARAAYQRALALDPGDSGLLAGYLWLLVDSGDAAGIRPMLGPLAREARASPELADALAAAYTQLHEPQRALPWLARAWPTRKNDPLWLMNYADTLEQADHADAAWTLRRRAYGLLAQAQAAPQSPRRARARARLRSLAQLASTLAPGDPARTRIERLATRPDSAQARIAVLAWTLDQQAYPLARWWWLRAFVRQSPPAWAQLSMALAREDGSTLSRLLTRQRDALPRRDRVDAARKLGWTSLAQSLAFQGLAGEPRDERLQRQFRALALRGSDSVGIRPAVTEESSLLSQALRLRAAHWLSPRDLLTAQIDTAYQRTLDLTQIGTPPSMSHRWLLGWQHGVRHGQLSVDLGAGSNVASWSRFGFGWHARWSHWLETTLGATAGMTPDDTAALSVGAVENRVSGAAFAQLTPRTLVQAQANMGQLRAQGGGSLGIARRFALDADYQLWFAPPDFTLHASVSGAHYDPAATVPSQLDALVPSDETPAVDFFVPASFTQACGGAHFNMQYETLYTARLRPYASADFCANSVDGPGYDLTAGLAMPVLGPDHLSLSLALENNVGSQGGRTQSVMLRYRHYFSPTQ
ncbi:MAG: tetratricopeptide repeat protein [Betaproteobacteria bacterium]|nr:tetratricopeptide repeat protein [Betaproteobacteria bacterium]